MRRVVVDPNDKYVVVTPDIEQSLFDLEHSKYRKQ